MITLLLILFAIIALLILFYPNEKLIKFWGAAVFILLVLTAGLREYSYDYDIYLYLFRYTSEIDVEPSFRMISYFIKNILDGTSMYLFFIFALIGVFVKLKGIANLSSQFLLCLAIYFSNYFLLHEMTQIRAGVASGFLLLSLPALHHGNVKKFLFYGLLAVSFHYSALLIFPLWFLRNRFNMTWLYSSVLLGFAIYFVGFNFVNNIQIPGIPAVQEKIRIYLALQELENDKINVFNAVYLSKITIFYILLLNFKKLLPYNKYLPLLMNIYAISLFSYAIFAEVPAFASRISELLGVVDIILIPMIAYLLKPVVLGRVVVLILALIYLLINLYYVELIIDYDLGSSYFI